MNINTGPYFNSSGKPILRKSAIVVADILGYKQAVQRASQENQSEQLLEIFFGAIEDAFRNVDDPSGTKRYAKMMSDNLIVGYPVLGDESGIFEFMQVSFNGGHFQRELVKYGFPIRGGVSIGKIHISELLVFSDGNVLQEMLKTDHIAKHPRIVLMNSAKSFLSEHWNSLTDRLKSEIDILLWNDNDGERYVNYLRPLSGITGTDKLHLLQMHKDFIEGSLKEFSECNRVYTKYVWLANYHNKFCQPVPRFNSAEFMIDMIY